MSTSKPPSLALLYPGDRSMRDRADPAESRFAALFDAFTAAGHPHRASRLPRRLRRRGCGPTARRRRRADLVQPDRIGPAARSPRCDAARCRGRGRPGQRAPGHHPAHGHEGRVGPDARSALRQRRASDRLAAPTAGGLAAALARWRARAQAAPWTQRRRRVARRACRSGCRHRAPAPCPAWQRGERWSPSTPWCKRWRRTSSPPPVAT